MFTDRPLYLVFWQRLLSAGCITPHGDEADFFFFPLSVRGPTEGVHLEAAIAYVRQLWPWWDRHGGGGKHLIIHPGAGLGWGVAGRRVGAPVCAGSPFSPRLRRRRSLCRGRWRRRRRRRHRAEARVSASRGCLLRCVRGAGAQATLGGPSSRATPSSWLRTPRSCRTGASRRTTPSQVSGWLLSPQPLLCGASLCFARGPHAGLPLLR